MINLLPHPARNRALLEYRLRLFAVIGFALAGLLAALAALLMPSYFFAMLARTQSSTEEQAVNASLSGTQTAEAAAQEKTTALLFAAIQKESAYPRPSQSIEAILSLAHKGVAIERVEYLTAAKGTTLHVSGVALTRDNLISYKDALTNVPGVESVSLPLATLALSDDIPFSISFTFDASEAAKALAASSTPNMASTTSATSATSSPKK